MTLVRVGGHDDDRLRPATVAGPGDDAPVVLVLSAAGLPLESTVPLLAVGGGPLLELVTPGDTGRMLDDIRRGFTALASTRLAARVAEA